MTEQRANRPPFKMPEPKGFVWPAIKFWLVGPVVLFMVLQIVASIYRAYQGSVEGGMAADQLKDESGAVGRSILVAQSDIPGTINIIAWVVLILFIFLYAVRAGYAYGEWRRTRQ